MSQHVSPPGRVAAEYEINGRRCQVVHHDDDAPAAPIDIYITEAAFGLLLAQIADHPAEAGSFLFGPLPGFGVDLVEKDFRGSKSSGAAVYVPNSEWGRDRLRHHANRPEADVRIFTGIAHSHPSGGGHLSRKVGAAKGDLGYTEALFPSLPAIEVLAMPVFTGTGRGEVAQLHPWIVERSRPCTALAAHLRVCTPDMFPARPFNPAAETPMGPPMLPVTCPVDIDRLARHLKAKVALVPTTRNGWTSIEVRFRRAGTRLSIELPPGFPAVGPDVLVTTASDRLVAATFGWRPHSGRDVTRRLAELCEDVVCRARRRF